MARNEQLFDQTVQFDGVLAQGFAAGEYVATQFVVERDADALANAGQSDAAAADSTHAIMRRFIARLAVEPGADALGGDHGPGGGGRRPRGAVVDRIEGLSLGRLRP